MEGQEAEDAQLNREANSPLALPLSASFDEGHITTQLLHSAKPPSMRTNQYAQSSIHPPPWNEERVRAIPMPLQEHLI
jgi:hypothetical protein